MADQYPITPRLHARPGARVARPWLPFGCAAAACLFVMTMAMGSAQAEAPVATKPDTPLVVFLGDSLTAGLGLPENEAYPAVIARRLAERGHPIRAVNAGVSGDTSAGGLRRLDWVLKQKPDLLVVALGANDALRGQPVESLEANLRAIVTKARAAGAKVLLLGMRIPTNYGPDYTEAFAAVYAKIARDMKLPLVAFLLDGVGGHPELNQADGLHPTAAGQEIVATNVRPALERLLAERSAPPKKP